VEQNALAQVQRPSLSSSQHPLATNQNVLAQVQWGSFLDIGFVKERPLATNQNALAQVQW
jgi:hypothetical protein